MDDNEKLYNSLKSIFLHIDNQEKILLSQFNLTTPRFNILSHINNHPGINYNDLSDLMLCTKGNTTRVVSAMLDDGLVSRTGNPEDRRSYHLFLTDKGQNLYKEVHRAYHQHIDHLLSTLNEDQLNIYTVVSHQIENTLASVD